MPKTNYTDKQLMVRRKLSKVKKNIIQRTENPNDPSFSLYGARGVRICSRWRNFNKFVEDVVTIDGYDDNLLLQGKIALDKDIKGTGFIYDKSNCYWVSLSENNKHKPNQMIRFKVIDTTSNTLLGTFDNQSEVARMLDVFPATVSRSLRNGIPYKNFLMEYI